MNRILPIAGWLAITVLLAISFAIDVRNTCQGGSVDFRNRITGERLLTHGIDPYHYKWREGDPPEYIDLRNTTVAPVSKTTATPAFLVLQMPLSTLPYRTAQITWLVLQWLLLLGTGWLWFRATTTASSRWLIVFFITAFSYTQAWRWHAERGQEYVVMVFLFACWMVLTRDAKRSGLAAGLMAGLLITLRPPFLLLLPFMALHRRGQWKGAAAGLIVGIVAPVFWSPAFWNDYFSAMQTYADLYRNGVNPAHATFHYPPTIEGLPLAVIGNLYPFHTGDFSVHSLLRLWGLEPVSSLLLLVMMGLPFVAWLWLSRNNSVDRLLPGLAAWFFIADLFLPAIRFSYHDVFILNVVLAGFALTGKFPAAAWPCAAALSMSWAVYAFSLNTPWVVNLPPAFYTLSAILFLLPSPRAKPEVKPEVKSKTS